MSTPKTDKARKEMTCLAFIRFTGSLEERVEELKEELNAANKNYELLMNAHQACQRRIMKLETAIEFHKAEMPEWCEDPIPPDITLWKIIQ